MKLGFICLDLPGHLNPMSALARQPRHATMMLSSFIRHVLPGYRLFLGPEKEDADRPNLSRKCA